MIKTVIFLISFSLSLFAIDIADIIDSIDRMNTSAKIPKKVQYHVYDPFSGAKPMVDSKNNTLEKTSIVIEPVILQTILNNRAFIDGKWYNKGDKVREFELVAINSDSVVLMKNSKKTILRLKIIENILEMKEQEK